MMNDLDYIGAILKRLDKLDTEHYTTRCSISMNDKKDMDGTQAPASDNESDFDNSDEDLASLLAGDDDDDEFLQKLKSPLKSDKAFSSTAKKSKDQTKFASPNQSFESSSKEKTKPHKAKSVPTDEFSDDILNDFIESSVSKTVTPEKSKGKATRGSFQNEDADSLDDLSLSHFSPSKDLSKKSPIKKTKSTEKSSDTLDDFNANKTSSRTSEGRRGSFFDDFLESLSPIHGSKKPTTPDISEEKLKINEESEEDILGVYVPTTPKKNDDVLNGFSKSPKKRNSLVKQVSFKDLSDDFSSTGMHVAKSVALPEENVSKQFLPESKKNEGTLRTRRSEKANVNKDDDVDWLNFFKDSPKKSSKPPEVKQKSNEPREKTDLTGVGKSKPIMKRQSSADWLGLSDSQMLDDGDDSVNDDNTVGQVKLDQFNSENLEPVRPKAATAPVIRPQRQSVNKALDEWNNKGDDFIKSTSRQPTTDLPQLLRDTDSKLPERAAKSASFIKHSPEIEHIESFSASKGRNDSKTTPKVGIVSKDAVSSSFISARTISQKDFVPKDHTSQVRDSQESYEHTTMLHSLQLMLDDSIKERNRLLKDHEAVKSVLEEKLKASEEFSKSEKKMLEESFKTLESSLKKEFEIKIKSLEERLNLITEEKEKQAKNFEEKFQNILKDHQLEVQRLKDIHNHSISLMKEDHEDALLRLKKMKEQEIEAVLSTQAHSKSLEYLSNQLEARACELASLQNKLEERNQSTLREKQALLDAREKDLKALQNRLQKQLEDSEEERTRLQQLVLRLEGRLQKVTVEGEEDHWETQQLKAKLTIQQKYLEEEQKLYQYQMEKEKEKLKISQDSLLQEQKTVLLQLAQERQQLTQEKIDLQSLAKNIREEETKFNVRKLKEESSIEAEKQFLLEEKNKLHFEKEKIKQEFYQLERERDSLLREKQQLKQEREALHDKEMFLKRKASEIEEMSAASAQESEKGRRDHTEALAMKKDHQLKMQQYTQQMQMLMDRERNILSEKEKLMEEKMEFEQNKNSVLCTKCKLSPENPIQDSGPSPSLNMPVIFPLPNMNGISTQVQQSFLDPNLVVWHLSAEKDREFLQQELAFLKSLKKKKEKKEYSK